MNETNHPYLIETSVSGALFGAVAAGRVDTGPRPGSPGRRHGRDYLRMPDPAAWGPDLDVTDYMAALAAAGYVVRDGDGWRLTADGEIKASEYAVNALHHPHVLETRKAWAAMSGALIRLGRHEAPTVEQLAAVGTAHATYLLGHHALHGQVATAYERHLRAIDMLEAWMRTFGEDDAASAAGVYRILAFLRGEDISELGRPELADSSA